MIYRHFCCKKGVVGQGRSGDVPPYPYNPVDYEHTRHYPCLCVLSTGGLTEVQVFFWVAHGLFRITCRAEGSQTRSYPFSVDLSPLMLIGRRLPPHPLLLLYRPLPSKSLKNHKVSHKDDKLVFLLMPIDFVFLCFQWTGWQGMLQLTSPPCPSFLNKSFHVPLTNFY